MKTLSMLPVKALTPAPEGTQVAELNLVFRDPFETQVRGYFDGLGNSGRGVTHVAISGQSVAACLALPIFEMLGGARLPYLALIKYGTTNVAAWLDAATYRHHTVRSRRDEIPMGDEFAGYTVIDGAGRGLTSVHLSDLATILSCKEENIRVVKAAMGQVDLTSPEGATKGVVETLLATGLTQADWASSRLLFLPGGSGIVSAIQAVAIHGLSERWARTIRLDKRGDEFRIVEVVDPHEMRQWAMSLARHLDEAQPKVTLSGQIPEAFRTALAALAAEHGVEIRG